jgi:hypothetical protein
MIQDSFYWKQSLLRQATILHEKLEQRVWRNSSFGKIEQSIMMGSFIVRKLAESSKISDKLYQHPLDMGAYPATGKLVMLLNRHKIIELYEVKGGTNVTEPLQYVVNQIIHSFVFEFVFEGSNKIFGVVFNSDRSKSKLLYMLPLARHYRRFHQMRKRLP